MNVEGKANSNVLKGYVSNPSVIHGKSAYEIAVMNGFDGTEGEWLESLKGDKGETGDGIFIKYSGLENPITLVDGYFIYENCKILSTPADPTANTETVVRGKHIFIGCEFDHLYIEGGEYEFRNCTFGKFITENSTARFYSCIGTSIRMVGNCHNSVIDGCKLEMEAYAPIIFAGGVADNVRISNNTVINKAPTGYLNSENTFQTECINTHGITNSIIENNYCVSFIATNTSGVKWGGYGIDVSGHSTKSGDIRSYNNVIRNNVVKCSNDDGGVGIIIYAAKDIICQGNTVSGYLMVGGEYQDEVDYGEILIQGNYVQRYRTFIQSNPILKIMIIGNVAFAESNCLENSYNFGDNVKVFYFNNTQHGVLMSTGTVKITMPEEFVYVPANTSVFIPQCYVVASDGVSGLANGSWFNGGVVTGDGFNRWVRYYKIGTHASRKEWWTQ